MPPDWPATPASGCATAPKGRATVGGCGALLAERGHMAPEPQLARHWGRVACLYQVGSSRIEARRLKGAAVAAESVSST